MDTKALKLSNNLVGLYLSKEKFYFRSSRKARLKITIFSIHSPFLLSPFFKGKKKRKKNNQSRDFK